MAEEQQRPAARSSQARPPAAEAPTPEDVQRRFDEVYRSYTLVLQESSRAKHLRYVEVYQSYVRGIHEAIDEAQRRCAEAYREYIRASRESEAQVDMLQRRAEAYRNYTRTLLEQQLEAQRRCVEVTHNYWQEIQKASEDSRQRSAESSRAYLRGLREAWAQVDVNSSDVGFLASLAQSMMWAGLWTRGTVA